MSLLTGIVDADLSDLSLSAVTLKMFVVVQVFKFILKLRFPTNDSKRVENIDQIAQDSSHRTIKKMEFFIGERYPLHISCHEIENL